MFDTYIVLVSLIICAFFFSLIAMGLSAAAIAVIIGFKNSTHTIEWKPLDAHKAESDDPFETTEEEAEKFTNPLKRKVFKIDNPFPSEPIKDDELFADLDDPNEESHKF